MTATPHHRAMTDEALADEIELVGALLAATAGNAGRLTQEEIDEALGVGHVEDRAHGRPGTGD